VGWRVLSSCGWLEKFVGAGIKGSRRFFVGLFCKLSTSLLFSCDGPLAPLCNFSSLPDA
jgi:hypothetical protein